MPRHVAFLRGMNLGRRRITNDELGRCFTAMGLREVVVYQASGNVIFDTQRRAPAALQQKIEAELEAALGYAVPTFLRSAEQVRAIADRLLFGEVPAGAKPQVMLLGKALTPAQRREVLALATDDDQLAFGDAELHWLPRGRMSDSQLDLVRLAKLIGPTTIRTHGTISRIAAKFLG